jgi:hypothetical protein
MKETSTTLDMPGELTYNPSWKRSSIALKQLRTPVPATCGIGFEERRRRLACEKLLTV